MNSILHKELIGLKGSLNYWLAIGWVFAILISLIAILVVVIQRSKKSATEKESINSYNDSSKPLANKGFK
tara:strand:- start:1095 stop:1304 length:210 start_codon:yes stop_codon:yes gene_type:complete